MEQARIIYNEAVPARRSADRIHSRHHHPRLATVIVGLSALLVLLPVILASLSLILFQVNQWNLPGVYIVDQNVGMLDPLETAALVNRTWNLDRQIQLISAEDPNAVFWLTSQELGYWVDPAATALKAQDIARETEPFKDIVRSLKGESHLVLPVVYHDQETARKSLEKLAEVLTIPAENARIIYQNGEWVVTPAVDGRTLDIEATLSDLNQNALTHIHTQSATLYFKPIPAAIQDLSPVLAEIEGVLQKELLLEAYDPLSDERFTWSVPIEKKREWIQVDPQSYTVNFSFEQVELENLMKNWQSELGSGRTLGQLPGWDAIEESWENGQTIHAAILHEPIAYTVASGESLWSISLKLGMPMWYIMEANPGLSAENLITGMTLTIPSKNILLPLPVVEDKRILIDISEQKMSIYQAGELLRSHVVSTGISDSPTMAGIFQIQTHELNAYASNWDLYMPHFMGIYEAWPGFMNGIHGLPLLSSGRRLWASSLGSPASYGCIILDLEAAEDLYHWADPGVVVEIVN